MASRSNTKETRFSSAKIKIKIPLTKNNREKLEYNLNKLECHHK